MMLTSIEKLEKLHASVQKLETVLHEVWSCIDEIGDDEVFSQLMDKARHYKSKRQKPDESLEELCQVLDEFDNSMGLIPEDGTAAVDFEDAISELLDWMKHNHK